MKTVLPWLFLLLILITPDAFAGTSGASSIANQFIAQTASWYNEIKTVAEEIFYALFGIDFVYLVTQWLIGGKDAHEIFTSFIKKLMTIGFFYFLLMDGHTLVLDAINGFKQTAIAAAGPVRTGLQGILQTGFDMFKTCVEGPMVPTKGGVLQYAWDVVTSDGKTLVSTLVGALVGLVVGLIAILALIYLALEYLAIQVEASMVASIGVIMLGFSGSRWTVQHAEGYLKYALSVGVRFLVLMIWIAFIEGSTHTLLPNLLNGVKHTDGTNIVTTIDAYGNILIFALLIAWLTKKLPSLAASIVSGSSSLSGGSDGAALIASAAAAGLAAVGLTSVAGKGASGVLTGAQAANMGGAAGELKGAGGGGTFPGGGGGIAGGLSGSGGGGVRDMEDFPGAENAVPAPDPGTLKTKRQDAGFVLPPSNWGASPSASPKPAPGSSASQETPTTSATPSAGQQAPTPQEALRAALQQSIQQAFAPMQESLGKLNDTLAEGAGRQEKPEGFMDKVGKYQKGHQVAETLLSPGQAEKTGVQASSLGLKHSE
ncbi:P-type conjugative transfer protein TrbL [Acidithiobacillus caldus]|uniref:P-type conjugative transfer protein TrbL n=1 Tax=Acidithiobacillus caldus TaxID=33059 RepID=UPI0034E5E80A